MTTGVEKSLTLLDNTLKKLDLSIDQEVLEDVQKNGINGIRDAITNVLQNNSIKGIGAIKIGTAFATLEEALNLQKQGINDIPFSQEELQQELLNTSEETLDFLKKDAVESELRETRDKIADLDKKKKADSMLQSQLGEIKAYLENIETLNDEELEQALIHNKLTKQHIAATIAGAGNGGLGLLGKAAMGLAGLGPILKSLGKNLVKFGTLAGFGIDAFSAISDPALQNNSIGARAAAGALIGNSTTGNALKFGGAGLQVGAALGGPIGAIIGAIGGGLLGAAMSFLDKKKFADWIDDIMGEVGVVFSKEFWVGEGGVIGKIIGFPKRVDAFFRRQLDSFMGTYGEFKDRLTENFLPFKENMGILWGIITKPFTKEFWEDIFDTIGDFGKDIGDYIANKYTEIKEYLKDALIPDKILGFTLQEKDADGNLIGASKEVKAYSSDVIQRLGTQLERDRRNNENMRRSPLENMLGGGITSTNVNSGNNANVTVQNNQIMNPDSSFMEFSRRSTGWQ